LVDGRKVVVKAYPAGRSRSRLEAVLELQKEAVIAGMPGPVPVAGPASIGLGLAIAETALDVGRRPDLLDPVDRKTAAEGWVALSRVLEPLRSVLANTNDGAERVVGGLYPIPHSPLFDFEATSAGAEWIDAYARVASIAVKRLVAPFSVVHTDWRGDNIRVSEEGDRLVAIFDWESLGLRQTAVAVGEVAAMHSVDWARPHGPYFATAEECVAFAQAIEGARSTAFTIDEWNAVRAAILFGWCYTARCEHARAMVGDDKPEFGMRRRLACDGPALANDV
jgi:hypothetical protein